MVIVWGEVLWDRFPDGDQLGGAPANVACHLAQLGTPVALVTRVGDDADGRAAIDRLGELGVDTSLVQVDDQRATGEVTVGLDGGEPRYRLVADRAWEHIEMTAAIASALCSARALVFGTLAQRTARAATEFDAALRAASPRVLKVCDPNLRGGVTTAADNAALGQALAAADVCKLGEHEIAGVTARLGIEAPIDWLLERGARLVAITRGAAGSTWRAPGLTLDIAAAPARPGGDNVGCGDAYLAALVHGLLAGWPWPRIGHLASAVGAEIASARGATPPIDGPALVAASAATTR